MKNFLFFIILLPVIGFGQNRDYFTYLTEFEYNVFAQPTSKTATDVNFDNYDEPVYPVAFVKISQNQNQYFLVCYTDGPSGDPAYEFYFIDKNESEYIFTIAGSEIFIPGNGYLYVSGHTNNMFNKHKKFKFTGAGVEEVAQPFYYVGMQTKTITNIQLYSDYSCTQKLAVVGADSNIEIVAAEFDDLSQKYLIKTPFGLLGWWILDQEYPKSEEIEGLFYSGD